MFALLVTSVVVLPVRAAAWTAKAHKVGAIWVVLYDDDLGMVAQGQEHFFPDPKNPKIWSELYQLGSPDLVKVAEGFGADAYSINSPEALSGVMAAVLQGASEGRPQVVVAHVDRADIPPYYNPLYAPQPKKQPAPTGGPQRAGSSEEARND